MYGYLTKTSQAWPPNGHHYQFYFTHLERPWWTSTRTTIALRSWRKLLTENSTMWSCSQLVETYQWLPKCVTHQDTNKMACREATESNISLCFLLVMAGSLCWIPSDDILMFRIVFFAESSRHDTKGYRVAWVMHWLAQTLDYFVDTCGLRCTKTKAMMDKYDHQTTCDSKHLETERSIFSSIKSLLLFSVTCILGWQ